MVTKSRGGKGSPRASVRLCVRRGDGGAGRTRPLDGVPYLTRESPLYETGSLNTHKTNKIHPSFPSLTPHFYPLVKIESKLSYQAQRRVERDVVLRPSSHFKVQRTQQFMGLNLLPPTLDPYIPPLDPNLPARPNFSKPSRRLDSLRTLRRRGPVADAEPKSGTGDGAQKRSLTRQNRRVGVEPNQG